MKKLFQGVGWIIVALFVGALVGLLSPEFGLALAPVAKFVLQLIKAAATPLVFFAVLEALLRYKVAGNDFSRLLVLVFINAFVAIGLGLLIANIFVPGQYLHFLAPASAVAVQKMDIADLVAKQLPLSVAQPWVDNSIMPLVLVALVFGFAWRQVRARQNTQVQVLMEQGEIWLSLLREMSETVLIWIVKLAPFAVFAASAKVTAQHGLSPLKGLGQYVLLCLLGMAVHVLFTYSAWLIFFIKISLKQFWRYAMEPALYAFAVNSSLVALPLTLRALDQLGVSRRASTLAACVGTNLNNDGIILYEGFTVLALAQASGLDLGLSEQLFVALYCIIAAMGVAGVPEAGVVALTLVLGGLGLPTETVAILLSVDWLLARARSFLNTQSDMVGSLILNRWIYLAERNVKNE
ncbi:MAG TPA: dicarboxylate/amino acid:cation symporter [Pseudomonadales bacterium]|nr:dicarboxylate/amino acid:cation symporter [Pseudomonadales bacterium]